MPAFTCEIVASTAREVNLRCPTGGRLDTRVSAAVRVRGRVIASVIALSVALFRSSRLV